MGLIEFFTSIDWQQESDPTSHDFVVLPFFALFFPSVRFFLDRVVFEFSSALLELLLKLALPKIPSTSYGDRIHSSTTPSQLEKQGLYVITHAFALTYCCNAFLQEM
uniref:Uncharacterized protein n=1 Tax=Chenopodium quinoa TaxID=63459 RepID=A0A803L7I6_CHEQI